MVKLSKRLKEVASFIDKEDLVADIGCDHCYLSIYLGKNKLCRKIIASDINASPLDSGKNNIKKENLDGIIDVRLGGGLEAFREGEIDTVIICGMGGNVIRNILTFDTYKTKSLKKIILEPQSDFQVVRKCVLSLGFIITDEKFISESNKFYPILKCEKNNNTFESYLLKDYLKEELEFGRVLLNKKDKVLYDYINLKINSIENIKYIKEVKEKLDFLYNVLKRYY